MKIFSVNTQTLGNGQEQWFFIIDNQHFAHAPDLLSVAFSFIGRALTSVAHSRPVQSICHNSPSLGSFIYTDLFSEVKQKTCPGQKKPNPLISKGSCPGRPCFFSRQSKMTCSF
jgi:hypothetical protein